MARSLGLKVVGEGVESEWQLEFLRRESCDLAQGYMLSKPLTPVAYANLPGSVSSTTNADPAAKVVQLSSRM